MLEFIKSLNDSFKQRIRNPLIGTYSLFFLFYNWEAFIVLLFSEKDLETRIDYFNNSFNTKGYYVFFAPFIITLLYILVIPFLNWGIDWIKEKAIVERKNVQLKIRLIELNKLVEIANKEAQITSIKANYADIDTLNNKIKNLENINSGLNNKNEMLKVELENIELEMNKKKNFN